MEASPGKKKRGFPRAGMVNNQLSKMAAGLRQGCHN